MGVLHSELSFAAKALTIQINPFMTSNQAWLTSAERSDFFFKVQGDKHVELSLTTYTGHNQVSMYTVRISNAFSKDLRTGIWREYNTTQGKYRITSTILSQKHLSPFWVSWTGASVVLGRGSELGEDAVVSFTDDSETGPLEINAVAMSSSAPSTWEISDEEGKVYGRVKNNTFISF